MMHKKFSMSSTDSKRGKNKNNYISHLKSKLMCVTCKKQTHPMHFNDMRNRHKINVFSEIDTKNNVF